MTTPQQLFEKYWSALYPLANAVLPDDTLKEHTRHTWFAGRQAGLEEASALALKHCAGEEYPALCCGLEIEAAIRQAQEGP